MATGHGVATGLGIGPARTDSPPGCPLEQPAPCPPGACGSGVGKEGAAPRLIQGTGGAGEGAFGALQVAGMARLPRARGSRQGSAHTEQNL